MVSWSLPRADHEDCTARDSALGSKAPPQLSTDFSKNFPKFHGSTFTFGRVLQTLSIWMAWWRSVSAYVSMSLYQSSFTFALPLLSLLPKFSLLQKLFEIRALADGTFHKQCKRSRVPGSSLCTSSRSEKITRASSGISGRLPQHGFKQTVTTVHSHPSDQKLNSIATYTWQLA